jgi:hypothetical protein
MRLAFWSWTAVVVATDIALLALLPGWDNSGSLVSNTQLFVFLTLLLVAVWVIGWLLLRGAARGLAHWLEFRRIRARISARR